MCLSRQGWQHWTLDCILLKGVGRGEVPAVGDRGVVGARVSVGPGEKERDRGGVKRDTGQLSLSLPGATVWETEYICAI